MLKIITRVKEISKGIRNNGDKIDEFKKTTEKNLKKQSMKIDELLETVVELQEGNEAEYQNEELLKTVMVLLDSVHLISTYIKVQEESESQLLKQINILQNKINEQLVKSNIDLISNVEEDFIAKKHEVIATYKTNDADIAHGRIRKIIEKGYLHKGKIIRKAKVEAYIKERG